MDVKKLNAFWGKIRNAVESGDKEKRCKVIVALAKNGCDENDIKYVLNDCSYMGFVEMFYHEEAKGDANNGNV